MRIPVLFCATLALMALPALASPTQDYEIVELGAFGDGLESWAFDVNASGQVALSAHYESSSYFSRAGVWENGMIRPVSSPFNSFATGINVHGHFVGRLFNGPYVEDDAGLRTLPVLNAGGTHMALDINDHGVVVGYSYNGLSLFNVQAMNAVLWSADGSITDLGTLGGVFSQANAVNNLGWIVGSSGTEEGPRHAFVWDGAMSDLGTLGGKFSEAWDINEVGHIVGTSQNVQDAHRAFLVKGGRMIDLGTLPNARASEAFGINALDQVVGTSWDRDAGPQAVLFDAGTVHNLNDLIPDGSGWNLQVARRINDTGQIVGYGRHEGRTRAFLMTPTSIAGGSLRQRFLNSYSPPR